MFLNVEPDSETVVWCCGTKALEGLEKVIDDELGKTGNGPKLDEL